MLSSRALHPGIRNHSAQIALDEANAKCTELTQAMALFKTYMPEIAVPALKDEQARSGEFSRVSLRDAIKIVLQRASGPMLTNDIAKILEDGGLQSKARDFRSNVSATLSVMQSSHKEVQRLPEGWILSQPNLASDPENPKNEIAAQLWSRSTNTVPRVVELAYAPDLESGGATLLRGSVRVRIPSPAFRF
jgi:hypothetical protein